MIDGHGDDIWRYADIRMNFSTNIYGGEDTAPLGQYLKERLHVIYSYPEPASHSLEHLIARKYGIGDGEVLVTSGATDAIYLIAQTYRHLRTYSAIRPTFCEYDDACKVFGWEETATPSVCWICNPNNPTGQVWDDAHIHHLARQHQLLIVDQSYEDYTLKTVMSPRDALCDGHIIQFHSMTKRLCIPGLRLGYIIAPAEVIARLRSQYRPWAVNALAIEAGKWFFTHHAGERRGLDTYLAEAQRLREKLSGIDGIEVMPTETNFMLCTVTPATAAELKAHLASHGMLIRDASNFRGLTRHHFRISARSAQEDDALTEEIRQFIRSR